MWDRVPVARTMLIFTASRKASINRDHGFCRSLSRSGTTSLYTIWECAYWVERQRRDTISHSSCPVHTAAA